MIKRTLKIDNFLSDQKVTVTVGGLTMIERMPENELTKTKRTNFMRNKLLPAAALGLAALFGIACGNGTTDKKCDCPAGTVREYADSPECCEGEDCACGVKQTYSHTFGDRPVTINAPTGGLTEAQVSSIKSMLDTLAEGADAAVIWLKGQPGTLSVVIGSGYACTATTLTIRSNFSSDESLNTSVRSAVESAVPETCNCPNGTEHQFESDRCNIDGCECTVKQEYTFTAAGVSVVINVPPAGYDVDELKRHVTDYLEWSNNADPFIAGGITITVVDEDIYHDTTGNNSIKIGNLYPITYADVANLFDYMIMYTAMFDTSKETIRLASLGSAGVTRAQG